MVGGCLHTTGDEGPTCVDWGLWPIGQTRVTDEEAESTEAAPVFLTPICPLVGSAPQNDCIATAESPLWLCTACEGKCRPSSGLQAPVRRSHASPARYVAHTSHQLQSRLAVSLPLCQALPTPSLQAPPSLSSGITSDLPGICLGPPHMHWQVPLGAGVFQPLATFVQSPYPCPGPTSGAASLLSEWPVGPEGICHFPASALLVVCAHAHTFGVYLNDTDH